MPKPRFDADYYRRYYTNPATAVVTKSAARAEVRFVLAFYLHVITREDDVDEEASDMTGRFRPARWYLKRLEAQGFRNAGMGLFVSSGFSDFDPFALEVL